jgi:hypothetical protein
VNWLPDLSGMLAELWPQGGPVWDALARVTLHGSRGPGVLLVEAKSYPQELYSNGCCASEVSRGQIVRALQNTQRWLGVEQTDWTGPLYQSANRLAHLYFLREVAGVPTWFVNLCFAGDPLRRVVPPLTPSLGSRPRLPGLGRAGELACRVPSSWELPARAPGVLASLVRLLP